VISRSGRYVMCSRICASNSEYDDLISKLKITPCPHCKSVGYLNQHGFLYGYDQEHQHCKTTRATRIFCSNRNHAQGCGRTFSVWMAERIKHVFLSAQSLWQFLSDAVSSGNKLDAFRKLHCSLNHSAAYRIWKRFSSAISSIRTALCTLCEPPRIDSDCPAHLTLAHLQKAFNASTLSPIAAFAVKLQRFFL
jgi:hypothetical protein